MSGGWNIIKATHPVQHISGYRETLNLHLLSNYQVGDIRQIVAPSLIQEHDTIPALLRPLLESVSNI